MFHLNDLLEELDATQDERRAFQRSMAAARGEINGRDPDRNPYYEAPPEVVATWRNGQAPVSKERSRAFPSEPRRRRLPR